MKDSFGMNFESIRTIIFRLLSGTSPCDESNGDNGPPNKIITRISYLSQASCNFTLKLPFWNGTLLVNFLFTTQKQDRLVSVIISGCNMSQIYFSFV